ncbi:TM1812 family CRISPR-associated protein, partial [Dialister sp.]|uniref:TM1812 family CRISPR-associated protein n=1 Tax=Dialister sp. TaxID=1955814 RepID=UPI003F0D8955
NILLSYLSNVKVKRDNTGLAQPSDYPDLGIKTYITNESAAYYLKQKVGSIDKIFVFASEKVQEVLPVPEGKLGYGMTHLAFFRNRLIEDGVIRQEAADTVLPLPKGNENGSSSIVSCKGIEDGMDDVMESVLKMAGFIAEYYKKEKKAGNTVTIHLDLTGGPRDSVMMALAVMRLMEYRGLLPGCVLYSSWKDNKGKVLDVTDLYHIFDLISGAGEFKNYGSVNTLEAYFKSREISDQLQDILGKMRGFAKDIQISNRKQFQESISRLSDALEAFDNSMIQEIELHRKQENQPGGNRPDKKELNDLKFQILTKPIEREYENLIHAPDELSYIEWCLKHSYIQQALTLYTETVPDFLLKERILYFTDEQREALDKTMENDPDQNTVHNYKDSPMFYFINYVENPKVVLSVSKEGKEYAGKLGRTFRSFIDVIWQGLSASKRQEMPSEAADYFTEEHFQEAAGSMAELLNAMVEEHVCRMSETNRNCALSMMKAIWEIGKDPSVISAINTEETLQKKEYSCLGPFIHDIIVRSNWGKKLTNPAEGYGMKRYKRLLKDLSKEGEKEPIMNDADLSCYLLNGMLSLESVENEHVTKILKDDRKGRLDAVYWLLRVKRVSLGRGITVEDILSIVNDYRILKDVRNDTAHAKLDRSGKDESGQVFTADTVTEYIKDSIQLLRGCAEKANG